MTRQIERFDLFNKHQIEVKNHYDIPRPARRKIARKLAKKEYLSTRTEKAKNPPQPPSAESLRLRAEATHVLMQQNELNRSYGQKRRFYPSPEDVKRRAEERATERMKKPAPAPRTRIGRTWGALARVLRGK